MATAAVPRNRSETDRTRATNTTQPIVTILIVTERLKAVGAALSDRSNKQQQEDQQQL